MTKVVAGNWKMHHGPAAAESFFSRFRPRVRPTAVELLFFPPDLSLAASMGSARVPAGFGVQNIHPDEAGAFTGETSAEMARDAGAGFVLVGHSERRHLFGESDADVGAKVSAAVRAGLVPVVCVGELLEDRRAGRLGQVLRRQVAAFVDAARAAPRLLVAYEPVWAIGTGETATPDDASEAHAIVRAALGDLAAAPILYGGSVKPGNARSLMSAPDVDGVLVGGASLDPQVFALIAEAGAAAASADGDRSA